MKTEQEVRVVIDASVTMPAEDSAAVRRKVEAAARAFMRGRFKKFHRLEFAEEADLYGPGETKYTSLLTRP